MAQVSAQVAKLEVQLAELSNVSSEAVRFAATAILAAAESSKMIRLGLRQSKERGAKSPRKFLRRELSRFLAEERPQASALVVSGPAEVYLEQALCRRQDWQIYYRWKQRDSLQTKVDRIALVRACASSARDAIKSINQEPAAQGRHPDHATHTFVNNVADISQSVLKIKVTANGRTKFRKVLACSIPYAEIISEEIKNPDMRSRTIEKALNENPRFRGVTIAQKTST